MEEGVGIQPGLIGGKRGYSGDQRAGTETKGWGVSRRSPVGHSKDFAVERCREGSYVECWAIRNTRIRL